VEVQRSSGNVFADLGLPDAEKLKIKTGLAIEIRKAMRILGLTHMWNGPRCKVFFRAISHMGTVRSYVRPLSTAHGRWPR